MFRLGKLSQGGIGYDEAANVMNVDITTEI